MGVKEEVVDSDNMANINFHDVGKEEEALRLAYKDIVAF